MDRFHTALLKISEGRPTSLVITSAIWAISILFWWIPPIVRHWAEIPKYLVVFPILGTGLLWFYWQGHSWVRYLVLFILSLTLIGDIIKVIGMHVAFYSGIPLTRQMIPKVVRFLIDVYFVAWLSSPEASRYFSTEARHERQSLTAFEDWKRRQRGTA